MPLFDHLNAAPPAKGNGDSGGLSPIVPGRGGRPSFSLEALRERVESQFHAETVNRPDILRELQTEDQRRALVREVAEYVFAVEAVTLSAPDKAVLVERAYRSLFTFGPLDAYLRDDTVTEITVSGPHTVHVRHGLGPLAAVPAAFDDREHLRGLVQRLLPGDTPFVEAGVVLGERLARVVVAGPPVSPDTSLTIRLHPSQPVGLGDLSGRLGVIAPEGADLLRAVVQAGHGLLIVGDAALGKTTLAGALLPSLDGTLVAVERAAELDLPPGALRLTPVAPGADQPGLDFADQFQAALDHAPDWLIVDEIRGDESGPLWDVLARDEAPRCLWVFRGAGQPDRLRSALSMVVRKAQPALEQAALHRALARRVPFVAVLKRTADGPRLSVIGEWVVSVDGETLELRPLLILDGDQWRLTGNLPQRDLPLPRHFWERHP